MISINKQGNAIVIEFTDNDKYLFNGKIEVAPNELIVVVDQSDMVTFKRASNGDVLFSQLVDDIQIAGSPVTKDTVIDQFALIGFTSGGGSGGISDAPSDNKLYGRKNGNWSEVIIPSTDNFATKQEISDMLTKSEAASTYQPKGEYLTSIPEEYVTDSELSAKGYATTSQLSSKLDVLTYNSEKANFATKDELNSKADASAIADMATKTWVQGQGYLTEIPSNYVTDSELTEALANKQDKGNYALKSDLDNLATKEELAAKADASALSAKQDTLISGTNIKTINGETILGEGDITIQAGGTVDTAMSDTSTNAVQNKVIKKYIDDLVGNILTQLQEINGTN